MKKTFLFLVFALTLLVQIPFISSLQTITCGEVAPANQQTCLEILNSGLTDEEKNLLISNLDYSNNLFPDHDYVYQRNTNIKINSAPNGVQEKDSFYIKNAWADIFAVMPSILYKGDLYVPDNVKFLTGFNYGVRIPPDYQSSRYPKTSEGDCRRNYKIIENTAENKIYVNNVYQGKGKLVNLIINSDSIIEIKYKIRVSVDVNHYRWKKYCDDWDDGECDDWDYKCSYWYDETITDEVEITDSIKVKHYDNQLHTDIQAINQYQDTTKILPDFSNSLELGFENSEYNFYEYTYDIVYSKEPYYIYTLEANDYNQESLNNLLKDGSNLLVKNTNNCHYKTFDFFETIERDCTLLGEKVTLKIETDKLKYRQDEAITVSITPSDIPVTLTYAGETKQAIGEAIFTAKPLANKITATYNNYSAEKIVFLVDKERLKMYWNLSIFGLLNYCIYAFLRRGIGRFV